MKQAQERKLIEWSTRPPQFTPHLVINLSALQHYNWYELWEKFQETEKAIKASCNYRWANGQTYLEEQGRLYAIRVNTNRKTQKCYISLWEYSGCPHVGDFKLSLDKNGAVNLDDYYNLLKAIREYQKGVRHCSKCSEKINVSEIAGTIYAGVYCKDCTNTDWYKQEKSWEGK